MIGMANGLLIMDTRFPSDDCPNLKVSHELGFLLNRFWVLPYRLPTIGPLSLSSSNPSSAATVLSLPLVK